MIRGQIPIETRTDRDRCERIVESSEVGQLREPDLFEDTGRFAEEIDSVAVDLPRPIGHGPELSGIEADPYHEVR